MIVIEKREYHRDDTSKQEIEAIKERLKAILNPFHTTQKWKGL